MSPGGLALAWLVACGPGEVAITVEPGKPSVPLVQLLVVDADEPVTVTATATLGGEALAFASPAAATHVVVPLVGLSASDRWTVDVDVTGSRGTTSERLTVTPPALDDFPTVTVNASDPARMEPGFTLLPLTSTVGDATWLAALDAAGRVRWAYRTERRVLAVRRLGGGHLLLQTDEEVREIDWLGSTWARWTASPDPLANGIRVATTGFHHDVIETAAGTLVALTSHPDLRTDFPTSYSNPLFNSDALVSTDELLEFDRDGAIVSRVAIPDVLDLGRIGYDSLNVTEAGGYDWSHLNAVSEDTEADAWILSCRQQDAVFSLGRATGAVRWILANPDNWRPPLADLRLQPQGEPFRWPYHQHSPTWIDDGTAGAGRTLLLFDNGNHQASPWTDQLDLGDLQTTSRVVAYRIDEDARTVRQLWEFSPTPEVFSSAMGSAQWLPTTGNVLADFAFVHALDHAYNADYGRGVAYVRLVEFDPGTGDTIWDVDLWGAADDAASSWQSFRAERFPGFDPVLAE